MALINLLPKELTALQDLVRTNRENRTSPSWNFVEFFFLQEDLAFAFEELNLFDEALVQYDELDALLSQFVINSNIGDVPLWLQHLSEKIDEWYGVCLLKTNSSKIREKLKSSNGSLLDLRNYLFARQCELLFLQNKPWDVATRTLPFLQNCVAEIQILEIELPPGAMAVWVLLSSYEILHQCERYSDTFQMETYSLSCIPIWAYARKKLEELGYTCGLTPDGFNAEHSSQCLQKIVNLIAGMGPDPYLENSKSPQTKLKEALARPEAFLKNYLEISELTMGTYKHIGRMRCARLIGKELAQLYMKMEKHQQALPFLVDMEKVYGNEKWSCLLADTRKLLLECYEVLDDKNKLLRSLFLLASIPKASISERNIYLRRASDLVKTFNPDKRIIMPIDEIFPVSIVLLESKKSMVINSPVDLSISIYSNLTEVLSCQNLVVSLKRDALKENMRENHKSQPYKCQHLSKKLLNGSNKGYKCFEPELETYHTSMGVGVKCPNVNRYLKRSDSSHGMELNNKEIEKDESEYFFILSDLKIIPGENEFHLSFLTDKSGVYILNQLCVDLELSISFIKPLHEPHVCFSILEEEPSLKLAHLTTLSGLSSDIFAGILQHIVLQLNSGSLTFPPKTRFTLKGSQGLQFKLETDIEGPLQNEVQLDLADSLESFDFLTIPLIIKCELNHQKDASALERHISLFYQKEGSMKSVKSSFHLIPSFMTNMKIHTCVKRKFIEIFVHGMCSTPLELKNPTLKVVDDDSKDIYVKQLKSFESIMVWKDQCLHFLWELFCENNSLCKLSFSTNYTSQEEPTLQESYVYDFKINDFNTLYTVKAIIEPKGSEFCRVGSLCQLNVVIERVGIIEAPASVMYEVIADQSLWNFSGRIAGVIQADSINKHSLIFEVLPLTSGFLPVPTVRLSKYTSLNNPKSQGKLDVANLGEAKLSPFEIGHIYSFNRSSQIHILPSSGLIQPE